MITMKVNIIGLRQLERRFSDPRVVAVPLGWFLRRSANYVTPRIKQRIPSKGVNRHGYRRTGRARGSVLWLMDSSPIPRWVRIFSTVHYLRFLEYGTKRGLKARRYFRGTLRRTRRMIFQFARQARDDIARQLRGR